MDKKLLEDKLSEIAEWTYPCLSDATAIERITPASGAKDYKQTFTPKPDLGPRIIKFKDSITLRPCGWCGKILNQRQNITRQTIQRKGLPDIIQWNQSCQTCHRVWDPETNQLKPLSKPNKIRKVKEEINKIAWYNDPNYKG